MSNTQGQLNPDVIIRSNDHRKNKRTTGYVLKSLLAGGIAGCAAKTVIAPMDRVKILFQTDNPRYIKYSGSFFGVFRAIRDIHNGYGVRGLFQGHSATLLRIFPYAAIKFMSYEQYKDWIMPRKEDETAFRRTLAGSLAGVSSLFVSYPLDLLRTRLAYETRMPAVAGAAPISSPGLIETAKMIYDEPNPLSQQSKAFGGIANFYRGFVPTTYGMIPYAGVSFMCYESLKSWAVEQDGWWTYGSTKHRQGSLDDEGKSRQLTWWAQLTVGGVSGLVAQTASYPFEVIRRHMQIAGKIESLNNSGVGESNGGIKKFPSTLEMTKFIYRKRGFRGFFVGLSIGFMKVVPMHAEDLVFFAESLCYYNENSFQMQNNRSRAPQRPTDNAPQGYTNQQQQYDQGGYGQQRQVQRQQNAYPPRGQSQARNPQQQNPHQGYDQSIGQPMGGRANVYQQLEGHGVKRAPPKSTNKKRNMIIIIVAIVVIVLGGGGAATYFLMVKGSGSESSSATAASASTKPLQVQASSLSTNAGAILTTAAAVQPNQPSSNLIQINEGVSKQILTPGDGVTLPQSGVSTVSVLYNGTFLDGSVFDASSLHGNTPFSTVIGAGKVIPCWDYGVPTMSVGEVAELYCKSDYAYGAGGSPPIIPPNTDLNFWVSLLSVK
ncbi:UNVERIFIED_CONTAM: hypothetical protein HDU68_007842 [Siphonaria sp. JEL0065]|nr:hypothetical protein HDU68_007842 [Siphonaria sp. JEL0065]